MNEQERVAYLSSMGYQVYYPRFVLPGAKPSPRYELPVDVATASVVDDAASNAASSAASSPDSGTRSAPARPKVDRPVIDKPAPRKIEPESAVTEPVTASPVQEVSESLRFSLQYYPVNASLAVINEAPHQLAGRQGKEIQDLLLAILKALAITPPQQGLEAEQFNWPLAEGLDVMGDARRAAGLALQGFISQRQEQDRFQNLLVFTAQLADLLGPGDDKRDEHYGDHGEVVAGYNLCISHSLPAMIAHPQLKREAWAHLQALRDRLQTRR